MTDPITKPEFDIDALMQLVKSEEDFSPFFKKQAVSAQLGKGHWKHDPSLNCHRLTLPCGSTVRIKFFNAIKKIFDKKNVEVPGRESFISYIDVAVRPTGIKGYQFNHLQTQHVWGTSKSKAQIVHNGSLMKLLEVADALGIDLNEPNSWETYYAGKH